jgi:O-antigen ligase
MQLALVKRLDAVVFRIGNVEIKLLTALIYVTLVMVGAGFSCFIDFFDYAIVFLLSAIMLGIFALKHPQRVIHVLLIAVVFPSFMSFFMDLPYFINELNILYGMILLGFLINIFVKKPFLLKKPTLFVPAVLYFSVLTIGALQSYFSDHFTSLYLYDKITIISAGIVKPMIFVSLYFFGFLFLKKKNIITYITTISIILLIIIISAILERLGLTFRYSSFSVATGRWGGGFITNANVSSIVLTIYSIIIFVYIISSHNLNKLLKYYLLAVIFASLTVIAFLGSRSVLLVLPLMSIMILLRHKKQFLLYAAILSVTLYIITPNSVKQRFEYSGVDYYAIRDYSAGRSVIWQDVVDFVGVSKSKFIWGDGWESFRYKSYLHVSIHNLYLSHLGFYGIIGVLLLLFLLYSIMRIIMANLDQPLGMALFFAFIFYMSQIFFHDISITGREMAPFLLFLGLLEKKLKTCKKIGSFTK